MSAEQPTVERSSDRLVKRWGGIIALIGLLSAGVVAIASRWFVPVDAYAKDRERQTQINSDVATDHKLMRQEYDGRIQRLENVAERLETVTVDLRGLKNQLERRR